MLEQGRILGNYRIDGVLGQGGMGVVYAATQISLERTVALKILGADVSADSAFRQRFRREGLIQARLDHPNIVPVFEAGEFERHLFIAMLLVRGPTLKDLIVSGELDADRALRVLGPVADAVDAAHEAGLIHRDIKPQNILVGPRDHPYLADFGLTKTAGGPALTQTGQFMGTIDYIAPEQIHGRKVTERTDVYALGAVLFEALTGEVPYRRETEVAVLYAHVTQDPPRVSELRPDLPEALDGVIASAMAKAPEDRPACAAELLRSAQRAFGRSTSAAIALAGPAREPEQAGARDPEVGATELGATELGATKLRATMLGATELVARGPHSTTAAPSGTRARPATTRSGPARAWVALAPALLIIGLAGYAGGRSRSDGDERRTPTRVVATPGLQLRVPAQWTRARPPALPGLEFSNPVAVTPAPGSRNGLVAGKVLDGTGPDLLPATLSRRLGAAAPDGKPVGLVGLEALSYPRLRIRGSDLVVTLYAVATARGAATAACYAPAGSPATAVLDDCERVAATLRVSEPHVFGLGPDAGYGMRLRRVLTRFDRDRRGLRVRLGRARTRASQASLARRLAAVAGQAARGSSALTVSARDREVHDRLVHALAAARDGYERMAAAARDGRSSRFARAADTVRRAEVSVRTALAALGRLGYSS